MDCIIFDLDGTLVDSERLGMRTLLELAPATGLSLAEMISAYRGWKLGTVLENIEERLGRPLAPDFEATYRARLADVFSAELEAFPGVHDALAALDAPMCIASSGPMKKIQHSLSIAGLKPFFGENTFSAYDIGSWKPDPGLFLHAAAAMGARPSHCIVIEDSDVGVLAAKAAGMRALQYWPHGDAGATAPHFDDYRQLSARIAAAFG